MSNETEIATSPLHQAWLACRRAHDPATANMILTQHGGDGSGVASVPKSRVDACIAALTKLAGKPKNAPAAEDSSTGLDRMRKSAFARIGTELPMAAPKPPKSWDELQRTAMQKFNTPTGTTLGNEDA